MLDGNKSRLTLLNNWETTYFAFDEPKLSGLLDDTKKMGLDPTKTYKIQEINASTEGRRPGPSENGRSYTGDYLMKVGLSVGSATPLTSAVFEITE